MARRRRGTASPDAPSERPGTSWRAGLVLAGLLLLLHGPVLLWPFVSDDFAFVYASRNVGQLFTSFSEYSNYFRPIGRELYFLLGYTLAGNHPLPYHLFNFIALAGVVVLVVRLGERLAGPRAGVLAGTIYALLYSQRMVMAWVSCSQDLFATLFALASVHAMLSGHRGRGGAWHLAAMFSKESVATWPLVYALWRAWDAPPGTSVRKRLGTAARESAPLWFATLAWAVIVVAARALRRSWAHGPGTTLADVSLSASALWEGFRSALLSYVALEQPWSSIGRVLADAKFPWMQVAVVLPILVGLAWWSRKLRAPSTNRARTLSIGALWAVVGAIPLALAGHHYSAYYITFAGVGFALFLGRLLSNASPALVVVTLVSMTTLGLAANRVDLFNFTREEPEAGVSYITITRLDFERVYLDSLHAALARAHPAKGSRIYLTHAPRLTRFVTMDGRAPKVWFEDPELELHTIGEYQAPEPRPHLFLRFDFARWGYVNIPNEIMDASLAAEAAMSTGHPLEARAQLDRALAMVPPRGLEIVRLDLLNNRGSASKAIGDTAEARAAWRLALELDPSFPSAALNLARMEAEAGRLAAARETLERLLGHVPTNKDALSLLVRVERAQGDLAAAQATFARLSVVDPQEAEVLERQWAVPPQP